MCASFLSEVVECSAIECVEVLCLRREHACTLSVRSIHDEVVVVIMCAFESWREAEREPAVFLHLCTSTTMQRDLYEEASECGRHKASKHCSDLSWARLLALCPQQHTHMRVRSKTEVDIERATRGEGALGTRT